MPTTLPPPSLAHVPAQFISFEGVDGSGKSTQIKLFANYLRSLEINILTTREPGNSSIGPLIRDLILTGNRDKLAPLTELLLFNANRHEHVRQIIRPSLAKNQWTITDRFGDSTLIFQHIRGIPRDIVRNVTFLAADDTWPWATFLLMLPPKEGITRKDQMVLEGLKETRYESFDAAFHEKVYEGYEMLLEEHPHRMVRIDASGSVEEVQARIQAAFWQKLHTDFGHLLVNTTKNGRSA